MRYSASVLAFVLVVALLLAGGTLAGLHYVLIPFLRDIDAVQASQSVEKFFFSNYIQWCTSIIFYFVVVLLITRFLEQRSIARSLSRIQNSSSARAQADRIASSSFLSDRINRVEERCNTRGPVEAAALAKSILERDREGVDATYGMLGSSVQLMLAMGFFGTVWGISRSMFQSFTGITGTTAEQISQSLGQFTSGLSTALDTTVLALICSILAGLLITTVEWGEDGLFSRLEDWLGERTAASGAEGSASDQDILERLLPQLREIVQQGVAAARDPSGSPSGPESPLGPPRPSSSGTPTPRELRRGVRPGRTDDETTPE